MHGPFNEPPQIQLPPSWRLYEQVGESNFDDNSSIPRGFLPDSYDYHNSVEFSLKHDDESENNYFPLLNLQLTFNQATVESSSSETNNKKNGSMFSIKKHLERRLQE